MKVEVLYFRGCPNLEPAVERVQAALAAEGVTADVLQVEVADDAAAKALRFPGSPSVRINGSDIEERSGVSGAAGLSCRTYVNGSTREGIPSADSIRAAVRRAQGATP